MSQEQIVARIRKLLAMADPTRNSNEEEAATAMRMAMELLNKHNLDLSEVSTPSDCDPITGTSEYDVHTTLSPADTWFSVLCNSVSPLYFTKAVRFTQPKNQAMIRFFGRTHNVQTTALMAEYLRTAVLRLAERAVIRSRPASSDVPLFMRSFCEGAAARLHGRIQTLIDERNAPPSASASASSTGNTLPALVSSELALVDQYLQDNFNLVQSRSRARKTLGSAYRAGSEAAEGIGLHTQIANTEKTPCAALAF